MSVCNKLLLKKYIKCLKSKQSYPTEILNIAYCILQNESESSESEEFVKLSVTYLITFFIFLCVCILLKTFLDNSFHLFYEQN